MKYFIIVVVALICISIFMQVQSNGEIDQYEQVIKEREQNIQRLKSDLSIEQTKYTALDSATNSLKSELVFQKQSITIINQKYDEQANNVRTLPFDESIVFFANWLSEEDHLRQRHAGSNH